MQKKQYLKFILWDIVLQLNRTKRLFCVFTSTYKYASTLLGTNAIKLHKYKTKRHNKTFLYAFEHSLILLVINWNCVRNQLLLWLNLLLNTFLLWMSKWSIFLQYLYITLPLKINVFLFITMWLDSLLFIWFLYPKLISL